MEKEQQTMYSQYSTEFKDFISLVKDQIFVSLRQELNITDLSLINNELNFTNFVFKAFSTSKKYAIKTNIGERSIRYNFQSYLEDKNSYKQKILDTKPSALIDNQYQDYLTLNNLHIPTIEKEKIWKKENILILPYLEGNDLTSYCVQVDDIDSNMISELQYIMKSLQRLHKKKLIFGDLKMDNIFLTPEKILLIDPQIKEGTEPEDYGKLIFNAYLLGFYTKNANYYNVVSRLFIDNLLFDENQFLAYKDCGKQIYAKLVDLHYPLNSKECDIMKAYDQFTSIT